MAHHLYYSRNSIIANDDPGTKIDFMKEETIIFEGEPRQVFLRVITSKEVSSERKPDIEG